jgi:hypothetical protein
MFLFIGNLWLIVFLGAVWNMALMPPCFHKIICAHRASASLCDNSRNMGDEKTGFFLEINHGWAQMDTDFSQRIAGD